MTDSRCITGDALGFEFMGKALERYNKLSEYQRDKLLRFLNALNIEMPGGLQPEDQVYIEMGHDGDCLVGMQNGRCIAIIPREPVN